MRIEYNKNRDSQKKALLKTFSIFVKKTDALVVACFFTSKVLNYLFKKAKVNCGNLVLVYPCFEKSFDTLKFLHEKKQS